MGIFLFSDHTMNRKPTGFYSTPEGCRTARRSSRAVVGGLLKLTTTLDNFEIPRTFRRWGVALVTQNTTLAPMLPECLVFCSFEGCQSDGWKLHLRTAQVKHGSARKAPHLPSRFAAGRFDNNRCNTGSCSIAGDSTLCPRRTSGLSRTP